MFIVVLEMAILGLLKRQPMHGYDLRKRLRSDFGLLSSLSFGSLYPALARLEQDGAVREVAPAPAAPPAEVVAFTGSLAGERAAFRARLAARSTTGGTRSVRAATSSRTRKVYELTASGERLDAVHPTAAHRSLPLHSLVSVLVGSRALAVVPRRVAVDLVAVCPLTTLALPFPSPRISLSMIWHRRLDNHPAHRWLRATLRDAVASPQSAT